MLYNKCYKKEVVMPPRVKVTKEMVRDTAFDIIREDGYENLNVRAIADGLKCSTQPVLYNFKTMDEIRAAAYEKADELHTEYIMPKETDQDPMLALGLNYVRFGCEEKNLFRFLFQSDKFRGMDMDALMNDPALSGVISIMAEVLGVGSEEARRMFKSFFCVAHGLASLLANNSMEYDEKESKAMLESVFYGMIASRKG